MERSSSHAAVSSARLFAEFISDPSAAWPIERSSSSATPMSVGALAAVPMDWLSSCRPERTVTSRVRAP